MRSAEAVLSVCGNTVICSVYAMGNFHHPKCHLGSGLGGGTEETWHIDKAGLMPGASA